MPPNRGHSSGNLRRPDGSIDYRYGMPYARKRPKGYQARKGAPPLLFATDIRMTVLVTIAQARGPIRCMELWSHIGRKYVGCVRDLDARGLICKWALRKDEVYAALNPVHPAAAPLRKLLLLIGEVYGFEPPTLAGKRPPVPRRRWTERNSRATFGDHIRTLPLLALFVLGRAGVLEIARCVPVVSRDSVSRICWMYRAFGLLDCERERRTIAFRFNREHILTGAVLDVLGALDEAMPHWRMLAEAQRISERVPRHEPRTRRKHKRWKW